MRTRVLIGAATLLATGAVAVAHAGAPQAQPQPRPAPAPAMASAAAILPNTQALFDSLVREGKVPGIVAAFGLGRLPTVYVQAGKVADDAGAAPANPDSLWRVYSMTKPVTAMAAMILVEEGKIRLDQPLSDFFPAFKTMKVLTSPDTSLDSVPAKSPITIRELLTHSSGLGYNISAKGPLLKEYERLGILPGAVNREVEAKAKLVRPTSLAAFAERVAQAPLIAQPGTTWHYSIGLDVMGAVIEKASGMPFDRFLQTRIFAPLKMASTGFTVPQADVARLSTNYAFVGDNRAPLDPAATSVYLSPPSFPYGGAGLVSSARDYDRFLHMIQNYGELDGVRILKPETVKLATSNLLPAGVFFQGIGGGTGGTNAAAKMGFGAGGSVYLEDAPGGASKGTYGWGGAAGTIAWVDFAKNARGTIMVNYFPAEKWGLRQIVPAALAKDAARFQPR